MNILEGDAFEVKEAMKNEVEVWRWSIKLNFEGEEMVKTSEKFENEYIWRWCIWG